MDFDTLVNLGILFLFLVLPSLVKRKKTKKTMPVPQGGEKQKPSEKKGVFALFGKISDQIEHYRRQLERQARLQNQKAGKTVWEDLADPLPEDTGKDREPLEEAFQMEPWEEEDIGSPDAAKTLAKKFPESGPAKKKSIPGAGPVSEPDRMGASRLRQAVIWSEILGRPVSLRQGKGPFRN